MKKRNHAWIHRFKWKVPSPINNLQQDSRIDYISRVASSSYKRINVLHLIFFLHKLHVTILQHEAQNRSMIMLQSKFQLTCEEHLIKQILWSRDYTTLKYAASFSLQNLRLSWKSKSKSTCQVIHASFHNYQCHENSEGTFRPEDLESDHPLTNL